MYISFFLEKKKYGGYFYHDLLSLDREINN